MMGGLHGSRTPEGPKNHDSAELLLSSVDIVRTRAGQKCHGRIKESSVFYGKVRSVAAEAEVTAVLSSSMGETKTRKTLQISTGGFLRITRCSFTHRFWQ